MSKKISALILVIIMLLNVSASAFAEFDSINNYTELNKAETKINDNSKIWHYSNKYNYSDNYLYNRKSIQKHSGIYNVYKSITLEFVIETEQNHGTTDEVYLSIKFENGSQRNYILNTKNEQDFQSSSIGKYYVKLTKEDINVMGTPVAMQLKKYRGGDNWRPQSVTVMDCSHDSLIFSKALDFEFTDTNDTWTHSLIRDEGSNYFYILKTKSLSEPTGDVYSVLYLKDGTAIKTKLVNRMHGSSFVNLFKKGRTSNNYVTVGHPFKLKDIDRIEIFDDGGTLKLGFVKVYDINNVLIWDTDKNGGLNSHSNKHVINISSDNYDKCVEAPFVDVIMYKMITLDDKTLENTISLHLRDGRVIDVNVNSKHETVVAIAEKPYYFRDIEKVTYPLQNGENAWLGITIRSRRDVESITYYEKKLTNYSADAGEIDVYFSNKPGYSYKNGMVEVNFDEVKLEHSGGFTFLQSPYQVSDNGTEILGFTNHAYSQNPKYFSEDLEFSYNSYYDDVETVFEYFITLTDEQVKNNNDLLLQSNELGDKRYPQYRFELDVKNAEIGNGFDAEVVQYVGFLFMPVNDTLKIYRDEVSKKVFIDGKIRFKDVKYLHFKIKQDKSADDRLTGTTKGIFNRAYGSVEDLSNVASKEIDSVALINLRNKLYSKLPGDVVDYILEDCLDLGSGFIGDSVVDKLPIYIKVPFGNIIAETINEQVDTTDIIHKNMFASTIAASDIKDDYTIRYEFEITKDLKEMVADKAAFKITSTVDNGFLDDDYSVKVFYKDSANNWVDYSPKHIYQTGDKLNILTHGTDLGSKKAIAFEISTKMTRTLDVEELASEIKKLCDSLGIDFTYEEILNKVKEYTNGGDICEAITEFIVDNIPILGTVIAFTGLRDNIVSGVRRIFNAKPVENNVRFKNTKLNLIADAHPRAMFVSDMALKMSFPIVTEETEQYRNELNELKKSNKLTFNKSTEDLLAITDAIYNYNGEVAELRVIFNRPVSVKNNYAKLKLDTITNMELINPFIDSYHGKPCVVFSLNSSDLSLDSPDLLKSNKVNLEELLYRLILSDANILSLEENPLPLSSLKHLSGYKTLNVELPEVTDVNENINNTSDKKKIVLKLNNINAYVNNKIHELSTAPFVNKTTNKTLVPVRFVSEILGAEVKWLPQTRQVQIKNNGKQVLLTIDSNRVLVNNKQVIINSPAEIVGGKTFVPLRFVSETLGAAVEYLSATQEIVLTK